MTSQKRWTMVAVILGSGIVFLDSTVVNVALPRIARDLSSSIFRPLEGQSYVYNGYLLSLSALLVLAGALNDFYGRKRMFAIGLAGFGVTSLMCGLSPTMELLVLFRVLQGAAGALLVPGSLSLITSTFSGEEQGRAFGLWAGASAGTTILGPFVGGLLVDGVSWRAAFLINVPLVVFALFATTRVAESRDDSATGHFDWFGAFVIAIAVGGLSLGTIRGQERQWHDTIAFFALGLGAIGVVVFPIAMKRGKNPLVPLDLFKSRNFAVTNISTLLIYGALYVTFFFFGLFLQGTIGYTAAAAGLSGLPSSVPLTLFSSRIGRLGARYGPRVFMSAGPAVMAIGILVIAQVPPSTTPWRLALSHPSSLVPPMDYFTHLLPGFILFGIGLMLMVAPLTTALMTSVPSSKAGVASAINNAISRVGPQLAGALIFVAITATFYSGMSARLHVETGSAQFRKDVAPLNTPKNVNSEVRAAAKQESTDSFHLAMYVGAGLLLLGAAVNAVGISNKPAKEAALRAEHE